MLALLDADQLAALVDRRHAWGVDVIDEVGRASAIIRRSVRTAPYNMPLRLPYAIARRGAA